MGTSQRRQGHEIGRSQQGERSPAPAAPTVGPFSRTGPRASRLTPRSPLKTKLRGNGDPITRQNFSQIMGSGLSCYRNWPIPQARQNRFGWCGAPRRCGGGGVPGTTRCPRRSEACRDGTSAGRRERTPTKSRSRAAVHRRFRAPTPGPTIRPRKTGGGGVVIGDAASGRSALRCREGKGLNAAEHQTR